jgi:regulator of sirC expression with transglutaminase-like and TPR domain
VAISTFTGLTDDDLDWLAGALLIARDEYPSLDPRAELERLDALAAPLGSLSDLPAAGQLLALREQLVEREHFTGNVGDYYDPRNSFINDVLDRRVGIPISLALVWVEVGRRAGMRMAGVAFPGHFLARVEDPSGGDALIVDVFSGGHLVLPEQLQAMIERLSPGLRLDPDVLLPAGSRDTLVRMLMNLRAVHAQRGDWARLLVVLSRLIELYPDAEDHWRDRGYVAARLGAFGAAASDFERYLALAPLAGDVAEVRRALGQVREQGTVAN